MYKTHTTTQSNETEFGNQSSKILKSKAYGKLNGGFPHSKDFQPMFSSKLFFLNLKLKINIKLELIY